MSLYPKEILKELSQLATHLARLNEVLDEFKAAGFSIDLDLDHGDREGERLVSPSPSVRVFNVTAVNVAEIKKLYEPDKERSGR